MSHPDPTYETIRICNRCGEESGIKLVGDEAYDWCADCSFIEGNTHEERIEE